MFSNEQAGLPFYLWRGEDKERAYTLIGNTLSLLVASQMITEQESRQVLQELRLELQEQEQEHHDVVH